VVVLPETAQAPGQNNFGHGVKVKQSYSNHTETEVVLIKST
jgi:hypothetical protein